MKASFVLLAAVLASGVAAVAACSSSSNDSQPSTFPTDGDAGETGPFAGIVSIDVSPASADLLAGDTNTSQAFTAQGHFADGTTRDITSIVTWKASPDALVSLSGATATASGLRGGDVALAAIGGSVAGTATLHVKWVKTVLGDGVPAGSDARFKGTADDPTLAPSLLYPLSGVLVPPNLPAMEIQWKPAAGTDLFDVVVTGPNLEAHLIQKCNAIGSTGGCGFAPDANTWSTINQTLSGADPGSLVVRGAGATAGKSGASASASVQFAGEPVKGGLYYFNTKATPPDNKPGIFRYDFDSQKVGPFYTAGQCAGCHALSLDGTKMLAPICTDERGCGRPMQLAVVDVATKQVVTPPMPVGDSDTQTWSPDNRFYVTTPQCTGYSNQSPFYCNPVGPGDMQLIDATTNTAVMKIPAGAGAMYPSFSNDGKKLVYARAGTMKGPLSIQSAGIYSITFDASQTPPAWGAEQTLVTASATDFEDNFHPSFSPDDKWIIFTRSHCTAGDTPNGDINQSVCDSYNDHTARTWVLPAAGGTPIELALANGAGRSTVSWPKWSPFKTSYKGGEVFWITVAATRDYGLRATHDHDAQGNPSTGVTQLWLVAFDPAKAAAGQDPSFAPLWLPFQDVTSSNHIGQWTQKVVGQVN